MSSDVDDGGNILTTSDVRISHDDRSIIVSHLVQMAKLSGGESHIWCVDAGFIQKLKN